MITFEWTCRPRPRGQILKTWSVWQSGLLYGRTAHLSRHDLEHSIRNRHLFLSYRIRQIGLCLLSRLQRVIIDRAPLSVHESTKNSRSGWCCGSTFVDVEKFTLIPLLSWSTDFWETAILGKLNTSNVVIWRRISPVSGLRHSMYQV